MNDATATATFDPVYGRKIILDKLKCSRLTARSMMRDGLPIQTFGSGNGARWACDWSAVVEWFRRNPRWGRQRRKHVGTKGA